MKEEAVVAAVAVDVVVAVVSVWVHHRATCQGSHL